jgi:hypothetical protein
MILTLSIPSLQGTLAKRSKPTLQPNFAKEPCSPSHSNAYTADLDKTKNRALIASKYLKMNKAQHTTSGHKTLGTKWLFELQFSHQSLLYFDREVTPKSPTFHTASRQTV